ncbi:MAG: alpha/beta hydrolase [Pseudomonadales bacterium]|jgi:pimeloyl-ACP methyl ester carboxylesterase|nr:alpha/beta hydrolase [Pseudomonadales bacterium]
MTEISASLDARNVEARIGPPARVLALLEAPRALSEFATLGSAACLLARAPRGDGHGVLVLPGFTASDQSTAPMRRFLVQQGYQAEGWLLGRNMGPVDSPHMEGQLLARLSELREATAGRPVSLVGWSLGGVQARLLATRCPEWIRQVITLGSPIGADQRATSIHRFVEGVTRREIAPEAMAEGLGGAGWPRLAPPPVPCTAIYSRTDGIVSWRISREPPSPLTDNIEVRGSHCGLGFNPAVLWAIADRLALPEGAWTPFAREGWRRLVYGPAEPDPAGHAA